MGFLQVGFPQYWTWFWRALIEEKFVSCVRKCSCQLFWLYSDKKRVVSFLVMDHIDDAYRNKIATLLRAICAAKYAKEDNLPCQIDEVTECLKFLCVFILFYFIISLFSKFTEMTCFLWWKACDVTKPSCVSMGFIHATQTGTRCWICQT